MPITVEIPLRGISEQEMEFDVGMTADDFESVVNAGLNPADAGLTYGARYPRAISRDAHTRFGRARRTQGVVMDYTSSHPWAAMLAFGIILCACVATAIQEYLDIEKEKKKKKAAQQALISSYNKMQPFFQSRGEQKKINPIPPMSLPAFKQYIDTEFSNNTNLRKKYDQITINIDATDPNKSNLVFTKKPEQTGYFKQFVNKVAGPAWSAIGITVFMYWIAYAVSGLFNSDFGTYGATALPGFGFGISILLGMSYLAISYSQSKNQIAADQLETMEAAFELKKACERRHAFEQAKKAAGLGSRNDIQYQPYQPVPYTATAHKNPLMTTQFIGAFVGAYITMQYLAWLIVDITFKAAGVAIPGFALAQMIGGIALFAVAGIYSTYKTHGVYETNSGTASLASSPENTPSENAEPGKQNPLSIQNAPRPVDMKPVNRSVGDIFAILANKYNEKDTVSALHIAAIVIYKFALNFMTGAMLARIFLVKGTATLLPFIAASFSNPITLGLVIGIGVAWGMFQFYKAYREEVAKIEKAEYQKAQKEAEERFHTQQLENLNKNAPQKKSGNDKSYSGPDASVYGDVFQKRTSPPMIDLESPGSPASPSPQGSY